MFERSPRSATGFHSASRPWIQVVRAGVRTDAGGPPVLLIHGGGPGGLATFDLDVPGYSLAANIFLARYDVYVMDVRGFGRSSRPAFLRLSDPSAPSAVTSEMAGAGYRHCCHLHQQHVWRAGALAARFGI